MTKLAKQRQERIEKSNALSKQLLDLLSQPPASHSVTDLWKEHLEIRQLIDQISTHQNSSNTPAAAPDTASGPNQSAKTGGRQEALDNFLEWAKSPAANITVSGVTVDRFENFGGNFGLKAVEDLAEDHPIVIVPRKAVLSWDNVKKSLAFKEPMTSDPILSGMHNVALALFLLSERLRGEDSHWFPYIQFLPAEFSTPLFFTVEELTALKGSPVYEQSLRMYRSIARQFAYFHQILSNNPAINLLSKTSLTALNFTFCQYRWAVGCTSTRINLIPSNVQPGLLAPALIPFLDLANHKQGRLTTNFDDETQTAVTKTSKSYKAGEQVFICYGQRSNGEFLLHDGFVPTGLNENDHVTVKLGLNKRDKLLADRKHLLQLAGVDPTTEEFRIGMIKPIVEDRMIRFVKVFLADPATIGEIMANPAGQLDPLLLRNSGLEAKTWAFIRTRIELLMRGYSTAPASASTDKNPQQQNYHCYNQLMIKSLIESEKKLLNIAVEYAGRKMKTA